MVAILAAPRLRRRVVAAQLGVLRAGAAFTCLDPAFPDGQVRELLDDAARPRSSATRLAAAASARLTVPARRRRARRRPARGDPGRLTRDPMATSPPSWLTPSSLAYAIYTSGTSGRPKGVLIEHRSIANLVAGRPRRVRTRRRRSRRAGIVGRLRFVDRGDLAGAGRRAPRWSSPTTPRCGSARTWCRWLADERITVFCPPPTLLRSTGCEDPARGAAAPAPALRRRGGAAARRGRALGARPAAWSTATVRPRRRSRSCASGSTRGADDRHRPADRRRDRACVLDRRRRRRGGRRAGRAVHRRRRGGARLSRPARADGEPVRARIRCTAASTAPATSPRASADGRLFYRGRLDAQVKLRGYRIELEAIEARLAACDGVAAAAAAVQGEGTAQRLVAFVVPRDRSARTRPRRRCSITCARICRATWCRPTSASSTPCRRRSAASSIAQPCRGSTMRRRRRSPPSPPRTPVEATIAGGDAGGPARGRTPCRSTTTSSPTLGGDSLAAGLLVSAPARARRRRRGLATRDVYEARTAAGLAARARGTPADRGDPDAAGPGLDRSRGGGDGGADGVAARRADGGRDAGLAGGRAAGAVDRRARRPGRHRASRVPLASGAGSALWTPIAVLLTAARLTAAARPLSGPAAHRRGAACTCACGSSSGWPRSIPWDAMAGTHALTVTLRDARRARRPSRARPRRRRPGPRRWHLLTLGDHVSLARDASLRTVELDDGHVGHRPDRRRRRRHARRPRRRRPGAHVGAGASLGPLDVGAGRRPRPRRRAMGRRAGRARRSAPRRRPCPIAPVRSARGRTPAAIAGARTRWPPLRSGCRRWRSALAVLAVARSARLAALRAALWSPALWL